MIHQAGAIVVRRHRSAPEVLVVRARRNPEFWIFPKGHVEEGETLAQTAVRELAEEGGVVGEAIRPVGDSTFGLVTVTYFLVRYLRTLPIAERETQWCSPDAARRLVTFDDARRLIEAVEAAVAAGEV